MTTDKRREAFEAWADANKYPLKTDNVGYCHPETTRAWRIWIDALDSVVVELPKAEEFDGYYNSGIGYHKCDVIAAIESAGVRVKS